MCVVASHTTSLSLHCLCIKQLCKLSSHCYASHISIEFKWTTKTYALRAPLASSQWTTTKTYSHYCVLRFHMHQQKLCSCCYVVFSLLKWKTKKERHSRCCTLPLHSHFYAAVYSFFNNRNYIRALMHYIVEELTLLPLCLYATTYSLHYIHIAVCITFNLLEEFSLHSLR